MPDPRRHPIDVGPVGLHADGDSGDWVVRSAGSGAAPDAEVAAGWSDWVALAQRVLQTDALWRDLEARGDAWDEGHAAGRADAGARNPFR